MIKSSKFALTLLSVALLCGAAAGSAQATPTFTAGSYPAAVSGSASEIVIGTDGGVVRCPINYSGSLSAASSTLNLTTFVEYFNCSAWGFGSMTIVNNGCTQKFQASKKEAADQYKGLLTISCTGSAGIFLKITNAFATCEIEIKPQENLSTIDLDDVTGAPNRVAVGFEVANLAYNVTKDTGICPLEGTGATTNGTMTGKTFQLQAFNANKLSEEVGLAVTGE